MPTHDRNSLARRLLEAVGGVDPALLDDLQARHPELDLLGAVRLEGAAAPALLDQIQALVEPASFPVTPETVTAPGSRTAAWEGLAASVAGPLVGGPPQDTPTLTHAPSSLATPQPPLGRFGRYVLLERLGEGGMGVVYRARDPNLDREVALKVVSRSAGADESCYRDLVLRFLREARAAAGLTHPNIVAVHDVGEEGGTPYFTQELVPGRSLDRIVADRPLSPEESLHVVAAAARGLHHAHVHGIIHRDVKPANLIVSDDLRLVKVADFGIARRVGEPGQTMPGSLLGTPLYMSPEQATGETETLDPRTDVYALGAVLYECLAGRRMFDGTDVLSILDRVVEEEPIPPRKLRKRVPEELEWICLRCIEKDRARRYPTAQALADDLDRYLAGRPIEARPASLAYRLRKLVRRNRWAWGSGAAVFLVVVVALAIFLSQSARHRSLLDAREAANRATAAYAAGDLRGARRLAEMTLRIDPANQSARLWLARIRLREYQAGRGLPGARIVSGQVEFQPSRPETAELTRLRGEIQETFRGRSGEAFAEGTFLLLDGRYAESLERLRSVPQDEPGAWEAHIAEGYALSLLGRFEEAMERIQPCLTLDPSLVGPVWGRLAIARGLSAHLVGEEPSGWFAQADSMGQRMKEAGLPDEGRVLCGIAQLEWGRCWAAQGRDPEKRFAKAIASFDGARGTDALLARGEALLVLACYHAERGTIDPDDPREFGDAIDALTAAIEAESVSPVGWCYRANAYRARAQFHSSFGRGGREDLQCARSDYAAAVGRGPRHLEAAIGLARMVSALAWIHEREPARLVEALVAERDQLSTLLSGDSGAVAVYIARADVAQRLGDYRELYGQDGAHDYKTGIDDLDRALSLNPACAAAAMEKGVLRHHLAIALIRTGQEAGDAFREALADLSRAIEINPSYAKAYAERGLLRKVLGMSIGDRGEDPTATYIEAFDDLTRATMLNAFSPEAWVERGMVRQNLGNWRRRMGRDPEADFAAAIADLDRAVKMNPRSSDARCKLGIARQGLANHRRDRGEDPTALYLQAVADLSEALKLHPTFAEAYAVLGSVRRGMGDWKSHRDQDPSADYDAALVDFAHALEIDSASADTHWRSGQVRKNRALSLVRRGQDGTPGLKEAVEDFREAIARNGKSFRFWVDLGEAQWCLAHSEGMSAKHLDDAVSSLSRAISLNSSSAEAHRFRGLVYFDLEKWIEAAEDFRRAIELNPQLRGSLEPLIERANLPR